LGLTKGIFRLRVGSLIANRHFAQDDKGMSQPRLTMITTTGEKVEVIVARVALETGGHFLTLFQGQLGGWEDQKQNPVMFAFGNPTLAQNARVGQPALGGHR
jgi:hypothetical protein